MLIIFIYREYSRIKSHRRLLKRRETRRIFVFGKISLVIKGNYGSMCVETCEGSF